MPISMPVAMLMPMPMSVSMSMLMPKSIVSITLAPEVYKQNEVTLRLSDLSRCDISL